MINGEVFLAKAGQTEGGGVKLILPGQTTATQKEYKIIAGATVTAGDLVVCARLSGTYVVLGVIPAAEGGV